MFLQEGKDFDRRLLPSPSFPSVPKANVPLLLSPALWRLCFQLQDGDNSLPFTLCIQFWFLSEQNCEMKSICCLEYNLHIFTFCKVSHAFGCPVHVSLTRCPRRHGHLTHESAGCWSLSREECRKGPYLTLGFAWVCLSQLQASLGGQQGYLVPHLPPPPKLFRGWMQSRPLPKQTSSVNKWRGPVHPSCLPPQTREQNGGQKPHVGQGRWGASLTQP